ncbi:DUF4399 domain-containing protein [Shimia sp. SDUM112013]|uniref:DUF4399 domain-containing protein n=1 Tax=Shimia sp. SDUM112013 TaxID=3136160 RepID=UPI0032ED00E2
MRKLVLIAAMACAGWAHAGETPAPDGASVYFINLENGATVSGPVTVQFGLTGMGVAPAGVEKDNTGHHHLFLNRPPLGQGPDDAEILENGIPTDDNHKHFGGGQTEVQLDLPAGQHSLQLVLGDQYHVPHNPPVVSEVIVITVE